MRELRIERNDAGQRLDKYLHRYLREATNGFLYKMLRKKNIKLNGARAEGRELLSEGDIVTLYLSDETVEKFRGISGSDTSVYGTAATAQTPGTAGSHDDGSGAVSPLRPDEILYEDEDILIFVKPAGELSQKARPEDISINERMLAYLRMSEGGATPENEAPATVPKTPADAVTTSAGICNRLDRNTAGILLGGKTLPGTRLLSELIRERKIRKYYITSVECSDATAGPVFREKGANQDLQREDSCGRIKDGVLTAGSKGPDGLSEEWQVLHGYLVKDEKTNRVTIYDEPGKGRSEIRTAYRLLGTKQGPGGRYLATLEVELITGKTHQIRAHLASIGHPLAGDGKYGSRIPGPYELTAYKVVFPKDERLSEALQGKTITI